MTKDELIAFEAEVERQFSAGNIRGPVHCCGGNEDQLIDIFKQIKRTDWVFSTWRHDYHALLHGIPPDMLMAEIMAGRGMNFFSAEHRFFTSAIVGGILPIAVGVAHAIELRGDLDMVWCFVGDMASMSGMFFEATNYAYSLNLPIKFIVEDNLFSADSPTLDCWGGDTPLTTIYQNPMVDDYSYERTKPHAGIGHWVSFK